MSLALERITELGIVPVVQLSHPRRDALSLARALTAGGLPVAEITFRAAGAPEAIAAITRTFPEMLVGAGTVLTENQVDDAVAAGASFVVTPGLDVELVQYCKKRGVVIIPGCTTPTEYQTAYRLGLQVLKFFPAEQSGGLAKIKAMSAPFPMFRIMPTGGITLQNLQTCLASAFVCACGGSYMTAPALIERQEWETVTELCRKSVNLIKEVRKNGACCDLRGTDAASGAQRI